MSRRRCTVLRLLPHVAALFSVVYRLRFGELGVLLALLQVIDVETRPSVVTSRMGVTLVHPAWRESLWNSGVRLGIYDIRVSDQIEIKVMKGIAESMQPHTMPWRCNLFDVPTACSVGAGAALHRNLHSCSLEN